MKGSTVVLFSAKGQDAAALVVDGQLEDLLIDTDAPAPGTIFRGICDRQIKGAGGIFIKLPDGQRGYLRAAKGLRPGEQVLVQVTGFAEDGKALPVTPKVLFKSRYAIVTPGATGLNISRAIKDEEERVRLKVLAHDAELPEGTGLIIRSRAEGADDGAIADDIASMKHAAGAVMADDGTTPEMLLEGPGAHERAWSEWPDPDQMDDGPDAFDNHNLAELLEGVRAARVNLGSATAFIEPTRAMVAVDVNTGQDGSLAAGLKANIALARVLPRELRCRGLGGQITLDLAPMPKKDRRAWEHVLRSALRADSIETALAGWTPLGNYELQRKRERLPTAGLI